MPPPTTAIDAKPAPLPCARTRRSRSSPDAREAYPPGPPAALDSVGEKKTKLVECPPATPPATTSSCAAAAPSPSSRPPRTPRIWSPAPPSSATAPSRSPIATASRARRVSFRRRRPRACTRSWGPTSRSRPRPRTPRQARLLLLVESAAGYRNLCRLLTLGHARCAKGESRVRWEELAAHARGPRRARPRRRRARRRAARARAGVLRRRPPLRRRVAPSASAAPRRPRGAPWRWPKRRASRSSRRATCASPRPRIARSSTRSPACARRPRSTAPAAGSRATPSATCTRPREAAARFADRPAWLRATREIAERCAFSLADLGYRFPEFPVPRGETQMGWLRRLTEHGARERYGDPVPPRARAPARARAARDREARSRRLLPDRPRHRALREASSGSWRRGAARPPTAPCVTRSASPRSIPSPWACSSSASSRRSAASGPTSISTCRRARSASG